MKVQTTNLLIYKLIFEGQTKDALNTLDFSAIYYCVGH